MASMLPARPAFPTRKTGLPLLRVAACALLLQAAATFTPTTASAESVLRYAASAEPRTMDPVVNWLSVTHQHSYLVYDTLFSLDAALKPQPQMVGSVEKAEAGKGVRWLMTLRPGLAFHDGRPVAANDVVASIQRWAKRDVSGRKLVELGMVLEVVDEKRFAVSLPVDTPLLIESFAKPTAAGLFIMRAEEATTDPMTAVKEIIGSGPFRFRPDLWRTGDSMVLERNDKYVPRDEAPDFLSGGKRVKIEQLLLKVMPDDTTGANALAAGEIDYMQYLPFDFLALLERNKDVKLIGLGGIHMFQGNFRLNHASGPFADPAVRRVLWKLVDQKAILTAIGIPEKFRVDSCGSFFMCGTPLESEAGAGMAKLDIEGARAELKKTGYKGEPVVMLEVSGSISQTAGHVLAENLKAAGFTVDEQTMDWGTVLARRGKKEGWSIYPVYSNGVDMVSPLNHFYIANNCGDYAGWSCDARMTRLLEDFAKAPDAAARKGISDKIQEVSYETVPSVMWGQFSRPAGYRTRLKNMIESSFPMFWQVEA